MYSGGQTWPGDDHSMVSRMQKKFWKTKQVLIKVTRKKEDEHVVASDAELDAKLEVFHSIQATGSQLLKIIEKYQQALNELSQEENDFGRHLTVHAQQDGTQAGRMMKATGNALCAAAGQRLSLCVPLSRLQQEMATFTDWAVSDTLLTINHMEKARTEYRGALLWMKDVSQELDPDTCKQMDKFRKVQMEVRNTKSHFDKTKMDVCQKVDLLGASRCNLLSHSLAAYQTALLHFWRNTAHLMSDIQAEFQEAPPYTPSYLQPNRERSPQDQTDGGNHTLCESQGETAKPQGADPGDLYGGLCDLEDAGRMADAGEDPGHLLLDTTEGGEDFEQEFSFLRLQPPMSPGFPPEEPELFGGPGSEASPWGKQPAGVSGFLPSQLLDISLQGGLGGWMMHGLSSGGNTASSQDASLIKSPDLPANSLKPGSMDVSAWLHMFADLDPLASPGATDHSDSEAFSA